jgi:hypothetical protein
MSAPPDLFGAPQPAEVRETERTMLDRLNRRYATQIRNGNWTGPKFFRAEHVPIGLSWERTRICDFMAVDMHHASSGSGVSYWSSDRWSIRAPVFHGHEVKVSRSDWLTELRDPSKAETFRRHMHFWWLVVSDKAIVRDDLPEGWGLMVKSGSKLRALVKPTPNLDPEPMPAGLVGALLRASVGTEQRLTTSTSSTTDTTTTERHES